MKHLKRFNESTSDEYYKKIDYPYGVEYVYFDISTIREISKLIPNYSYKYERAVNLGEPSLNFVSKTPTLGPDSITIRQMNDEWFIVSLYYQDDRRNNTRTFKCDQVSGIEKLLQDKKVI